MFGVYIYSRGFILRLQNHVLYDIKIYQFRRAVIEIYDPHFAEDSTGPCHRIDHTLLAGFCPTTRKFRTALRWAQLENHFPQIVACINQLGGPHSAECISESQGPSTSGSLPAGEGNGTNVS